MSKSQDVIDACKNNWDANKADCSGFAKTVATALGVTLTGDANSIVDQITGAGWTVLADGAAAKNEADGGKFVVGALKGADNVPVEDHGHVVIVVSGPLAAAKYPSAYWGRLNGVGEQNKTTNFAWNKDSRDKVTYSAITF